MVRALSQIVSAIRRRELRVRKAKHLQSNFALHGNVSSHIENKFGELLYKAQGPLPERTRVRTRARKLLKWSLGFTKARHDKSVDWASAKFSDISEDVLCSAPVKALRRFCSEIGQAYLYNKRDPNQRSHSKYRKLYLSRGQMLNVLVRFKREKEHLEIDWVQINKDAGDIIRAQKKKKMTDKEILESINGFASLTKPKTRKRKLHEMEEIAWKEDIEQRKDGRIFHQTIGFLGDDEIRNWQKPGKAPMRNCGCDSCILHRKRRAEYILCSITHGRFDSYEIDKVYKQLREKENMDEIYGWDGLRDRIVQACRHKTVFIGRSLSRRVEDCIDPKLPIACVSKIRFQACVYCRAIQHINFQEDVDTARHFPGCIKHTANAECPRTRPGRQPHFSHDGIDAPFIKWYTCMEPHTDDCPFRTCRNADRYAQSVNQRGNPSDILHLTDFNCSLVKCKHSDAYDVVCAQKKIQSIEADIEGRGCDRKACFIIGCLRLSERSFDTRKGGRGTFIEHICFMHYQRLKRNKNRLSALWTKKELQDDPTRACSFSDTPKMNACTDSRDVPNTKQHIPEKKYNTRGKKSTAHVSLLQRKRAKRPQILDHRRAYHPGEILVDIPLESPPSSGSPPPSSGSLSSEERTTSNDEHEHDHE